MSKSWVFTFLSEAGSRHTLTAANERMARARLAYEHPGAVFALYSREPAAGEPDA